MMMALLNPGFNQLYILFDPDYHITLKTVSFFLSPRINIVGCWDRNVDKFSHIRGLTYLRQ